MSRKVCLSLAVACLIAVSSVAVAQENEPRAIVSMYQIAPGKHLEFLKWLAARDEASKAAGLPAGQLYAHTNGASWDYVVIAPELTPEQEKKLDEVSKKRALKIGVAASLEIRQFIATHSDTFAVGPTTAADVVARATK
jgi:membrane-bound lytic murein transglycosylase B